MTVLVNLIGGSFVGFFCAWYADTMFFRSGYRPGAHILLMGLSVYFSAYFSALYVFNNVLL